MTGEEEVVVIHVAVHASRNLSGFRAEGRASSLQKDHDDDTSDTRVRVGSKPAVAGSLVRAGTGLAEDLFFVEVQSQAARCAVLHRSGHPVREFRNHGSDVKLALDTRLETGNLFWSGRML